MSKEVKEKPAKINELILKRKADLKEGLDNIIVILGLYYIYFLIGWLSFGEGGRVCLKLDIEVKGFLLGIDVKPTLSCFKTEIRQLK